MDEAKKFLTNALQTLQERIGNPFIGAFCMAWAVWNFKIILVIFGAGKDGWREKIKYIFEELMTSRLDWFIHGYMIPGIAAAAWIFAFPPIFRKIQVWHETQLNKTRSAIYEATKTRALTQEEAVALREHLIEEKLKVDSDKEKSSRALKEQSLNIANLNEKLIIQETKNKSFIEELEKSKNLQKKLKDEIRDLNELLNPNAIDAQESDNLENTDMGYFLEKLGFTAFKNVKPSHFPVTHTYYNIYFPMTFERDVILEGVKVFSRKQILDADIASALISIAENPNIKDSSEISFSEFNNAILKHIKGDKEHTARALERGAYISTSPFGNIEMGKIIINQKSLNAGLCLKKLGFKNIPSQESV